MNSDPLCDNSAKLRKDFSTTEMNYLKPTCTKKSAKAVQD